MRILFLSIADPGDFSSGGNQRSNYIREALLRIADVDTIAFTQSDTSFIRDVWDGERVMKVSTAFAAGRLERMRYRIIARRMIAAADAANAYDFIVARYFRTAVLVPPTVYHKLVIDGDDLRKSGSGQSLAARLVVRIRATMIRAIARKVFHLWLVDPRDREAAPGARTSMLANTAHQYAISTRPPRGRRIMMVGFYAYPPNEEGLAWFACRVLPRLAERFHDIQFHAIGRYYKNELEVLDERLIMRGFVDDLSEEYRKADVVVCPIMSGSGTQIKVVEALMNGRPTVVSDFAYQGFSDMLRPDDHLLIAHDEDEWVRQIFSILDTPDDFVQMAEQGRAIAEQVYSRDAFSQRVVDTFAHCRALTSDCRPKPQ